MRSIHMNELVLEGKGPYLAWGADIPGDLLHTRPQPAERGVFFNHHNHRIVIEHFPDACLVKGFKTVDRNDRRRLSHFSFQAAGYI